MIDHKTLAFTVQTIEEGKIHTLYIPAPTKERVAAAAPVLGGLFSIKETSGLSPAVLSRDYEIYARRACDQVAESTAKVNKDKDAEADRLFDDFKGFIEASVLAATVIAPDMKTVSFIDAKISTDAKERAVGMYVFFYCIYRYAWEYLPEDARKAISTSLSITDFVKLLQTSSSGAETSVQKVGA